MAGLVSALLVVLLCSDAAHGRVWAPYSYRSRYGGNFRAAWTTDQIGFPSVAELKSFLQKWEPELAKGTITPDRVAIFSDSVAQALAPLMSLPMDKLQELVEKGNEIAANGGVESSEKPGGGGAGGAGGGMQMMMIPMGPPGGGKPSKKKKKKCCPAKPVCCTCCPPPKQNKCCGGGKKG
jgi:hypothetical protein